MKKQISHFFLCTILSTALLGCTTTQTGPSPQEKQDSKLTAANANIQLGFIYLQKGDVQAAKQKLLTALDLAPNYAPAWYSMGYYLEVTGNNQKAQEHYLKAIDLAPNSGDTQNNYGTFLCHTGKPKASIQHFLLATKDPNYLDIGAAYENAGLCALLIPDTAQAQQYFTKAITQDPSRTRSIEKLAEIYYHQGNYSKAYEAVKRFFKLTHATPETLFIASRSARKLNKTEEATNYSIQLQQNFPTSPQAKEIRKK